MSDTHIDIILDPADAIEEAPTAEGGEVVTLAETAAGETLPSHAVRNADGSVTLPLFYPVTLRFKKGTAGEIREEVFEQLVLHRLTGADMRAITAAERGSMTVVSIARSARLNEGKMNALFDRMDGADVSAAGQVVGFFLSGGRPTGR